MSTCLRSQQRDQRAIIRTQSAARITYLGYYYFFTASHGGKGKQARSVQVWATLHQVRAHIKKRALYPHALSCIWREGIVGLRVCVCQVLLIPLHPGSIPPTAEPIRGRSVCWAGKKDVSSVPDIAARVAEKAVPVVRITPT